MSYQQITDSEVDGDSIADTTLFTKLRDNIRDHVHGVSDVVGIGSVLGTLTSRSFDTVYQAATDLLVMASGVNTGGAASVTGVTDAANPPITQIIVASGANSWINITFPVKKGNYWKVATSGTLTTSSLYEVAIGT